MTRRFDTLSTRFAALRHLVRRRLGVFVAVSLATGLALAVAATAAVLRHGDARVAGLVVAAALALVAPWCSPAARGLREALGQERDDAGGSSRDELTGVYNRRHFNELAERELARCRRYPTSGALLLMDADHFRRVNDAHGHACGDALLKEISRVAAGSLRQADLLGRMGGGELGVFLPNTDPLGALDVADRIRERISGIRLRWEGAEVSVTASIGVASLEPSHVSLDALVQDAGMALFAAKAAGRNCVRAAPIRPRRSDETHPIATRR